MFDITLDIPTYMGSFLLKVLQGVIDIKSESLLSTFQNTNVQIRVFAHIERCPCHNFQHMFLVA